MCDRCVVYLDCISLAMDRFRTMSSMVHYISVLKNELIFFFYI